MTIKHGKRVSPAKTRARKGTSADDRPAWEQKAVSGFTQYALKERAVQEQLRDEHH